MKVSVHLFSILMLVTSVCASDAYNRWQASVPSVTYYVSPDGSNSNPGTYDEPWATPGYASKQLQAGDTLIILGGRYVLSEYYEDMITPLNSETENAWIVIKGEEGNTPVLAGRDNLSSAIALHGVSYIRIENLEITSDNGAWFREGINATDTEISHIVFRQLHIHHMDEFGVDLKDVNDLLIDECTITHCGFGSLGGPAGETGGWRNVLIRKCNISYNGHYYQGGDGSNRPYDRPDGFGIETSAGPIEIVNCIAEHNRGDGLDSKAANTYIHNSIVANNSCDGIKLWGDNSRVHNCLIYGTGDGVPGSTPWAAMVIGTETENAYFEIINVTIHDTPLTQNYPMYVQYDSPTRITLLMRNSIVANGYGPVFIRDSVNFTADHNIFYRPGEDVQVEANGRQYTTQQIEAGELGEGNLSRDPLFVAPAWGNTGDYHLKNGSPAIGAGTSNGAPAEDIEGNTRGTPPDIGAYESTVDVPPGALVIQTFSPVDVEVTDPKGRTISKDVSTIPSASYAEEDLDGDGDLDDEVTIPDPLLGDYLIQVVAEQGADPTDTYTLDVILGDESTTLADNVQIQDIPTQPYSFFCPQRSLKLGWNLISIPVQLADNTIDAALESIAGLFDSVWSWVCNPTHANGGYWMLYDPESPIISDLETFDPGNGYWVDMKDGAVLALDVQDVSDESSQLWQGWNLLAYKGTTAQSVEDALSSIAGHFSSAWAWECDPTHANGGYWMLYDPNSPLISDLETLEPGMGLWIDAIDECTWDVSGSAQTTLMLGHGDMKAQGRSLIPYDP